MSRRVAEDFVTRWARTIVLASQSHQSRGHFLLHDDPETMEEVAAILRRFGRALIAVGARERTARERTARERLLTGSPIIDAQRRALRKAR